MKVFVWASLMVPSDYIYYGWDAINMDVYQWWDDIELGDTPTTLEAFFNKFISIGGVNCQIISYSAVCNTLVAHGMMEDITLAYRDKLKAMGWHEKTQAIAHYHCFTNCPEKAEQNGDTT